MKAIIACAFGVVMFYSWFHAVRAYVSRNHAYGMVFEHTETTHHNTSGIEYDSSKVTTVSIYKFFDTKKITVKRIIEAKKEAGVPESAVMVSCYYLGRITVEEFNNE